MRATMSASRALHEGFLQSAARVPHRPAITIGEQMRTYAEVEQSCKALAATLMAKRPAGGVPLTCVLGQRTFEGFAGILGALCSGHGYVPMLPSYPAARLVKMIDRSESDVLVVDPGGKRVLPEVLETVGKPLLVVTLGFTFDGDAGRHTVLGDDDLLPASDWTAPQVRPDDIAYLLFTSGSTGEPKGVMVAHRNIERFIDWAVDRYSLGQHDRFSHMFEVTFDLSLFDMFAPWTVGGCLCVPDMRQRLLPAQYVVDAGITVWFSVPSTARLMKETRTLSPDCFPDVRLSLFCGEALTVSVGRTWMDSAPNAVTENIYGPTELTLACTTYPMGQAMEAEAENGVVPIGVPFEQMRAKVLTPGLVEVEPGELGELALAGPQVTLGYWRDEARTAKVFVTPPGEDALFYRTGDLVRRPCKEGEPLRFLGRLDSQVKVRGYRVELGEVEAILRKAASVDDAVALDWPRSESGGAEGIVGFVTGDGHDTKAILREMGKHLPRYMVPSELRTLDAFPLNTNGKIDRKALRASLES
jgi:amino acid adenylation domain-containing protein